MSETDECPFCLGPMEPEDREGREWLVCPNGCATEYEVPLRKPPGMEAEPETAAPQMLVHRAGA